MATKYYNWSGKVKWAKVYVPDEYNGAERFTIDFYPKDKSVWKSIKESGIMDVEGRKTYKDRDTGEEYIRIRRDAKKLIGDNIVWFSPPAISGEVSVYYVDEAGERVVSYEGPRRDFNPVGEQVPIGNDSKVVINVSVFETKKGAGCRLESISVRELVEYTADPEVAQQNLDNIPW